MAKTHAALFDTWFPLDELPIPPAIKSDIAGIAAEVPLRSVVAGQQLGRGGELGPRPNKSGETLASKCIRRECAGIRATGESLSVP